MKLFALRLKRKPNVTDGKADHAIGFERGDSAEDALSKVKAGNHLQWLVGDRTIRLEDYDVIAVELKNKR